MWYNGMIPRRVEQSQGIKGAKGHIFKLVWKSMTWDLQIMRRNVMFTRWQKCTM